MTIVLVHNFYQEPGGEDSVLANEEALLARHGHRVVRFTRHNDEVDGMGRLALAAATVWNGRAARDLRRLLERERPAVVHFHNTFPLISPAAYYAAARVGIPVVQTLHNYRLICPNAYLLRGGTTCEACVGRAFAWPGIVHACYRGDRKATAVAAAMLAAHRWAGTWSAKVGRFVALCEFARGRFVAGGLPADRIAVKPNFVDAAERPPVDAPRRGALYVGRLSREKGVPLLLQAARRSGVGLTIIGDGPVALSDLPSEVTALGRRDRAGVARAMREASYLVVPSPLYENFPMALVEAFAHGLPAVVFGHGAPAEIVEDGATGLHARPVEVGDLAAKMRWAADHPAEMRAMGANARRRYEERYTGDVNYGQLLDIYRAAGADLAEASAEPAQARAG
jgi:glycosyltransferase involved in cell wall biosynthesis